MSAIRHQRTDAILTNDDNMIQSFTDLNALKQNQGRTAIVGASGAFVEDSEGNKLIDGIGGLWCVNVGHGRREIIDAIAEQLESLDYFSTFYNFTHPTAAALANKVAALAPGNLNNVYFSNSGSVANDTAIRILHYYNNRLGRPKKKKILSRMWAYHGSTHLAAAMTTPHYSVGWDCADELVHHIRCPHKYLEGEGLTDSEFLDALCDDLEKEIHSIGAENIACFIAEPIMGAGGVIVPPPGYHKKMREITAAHDIKYISDEVVTAFGRLGHMFASETKFGVTPDIITTAKGITSGYQPLAATIVSDEIYDVIAGPGAVFLHGMTYSGHPACTAAGLANIELLERERIPQTVKKTGKVFETAMKGLVDSDLVGEVRGSHFMIGFELMKDKETKEKFPEEVNVAQLIAAEAYKRGLIVRPMVNRMVLSPPLILTEDQIHSIEATLRESLSVVSKKLLGQQ